MHDAPTYLKVQYRVDDSCDSDLNSFELPLGGRLLKMPRIR